MTRKQSAPVILPDAQPKSHTPQRYSPNATAWIVGQCSRNGIDHTCGNNDHRLKGINQSAKLTRKLITDKPKAQVEMPRMHLLAQQFVRINRSGRITEGLLIRNRGDYTWQVMDGARMLTDFTTDQVRKVEYRGNRWTLWI